MSVDRSFSWNGDAIAELIKKTGPMARFFDIGSMARNRRDTY